MFIRLILLAEAAEHCMIMAPLKATKCIRTDCNVLISIFICSIFKMCFPQRKNGLAKNAKLESDRGRITG